MSLADHRDEFSLVERAVLVLVRFVDFLLRLLHGQHFACRLLPRLYQLPGIEGAVAIGVDLVEGVDQLSIGLSCKRGRKFEERQLGMDVRAQLRDLDRHHVKAERAGQPRRDQPVKGIEHELDGAFPDGRHQGVVCDQEDRHAEGGREHGLGPFEVDEEHPSDDDRHAHALKHQVAEQHAERP